MTSLREDPIERWIIDDLIEEGYNFLDPEKLCTLRFNFGQLVLILQLINAIAKINPQLATSALRQTVIDGATVHIYYENRFVNQAGLDKPEVSIFSEDFMEDVRNMKQKNVAIELLKKLLSDQIKIRFKRNAVVNKNLSDKLQDAINKYNRKSITALEMLEILLEITDDVNKEKQ